MLVDLMEEFDHIAIHHQNRSQEYQKSAMMRVDATMMTMMTMMTTMMMAI
jgi:hypothetical protein